MNDDVSRAVEEAIKKTPAFQRSLDKNYLNRFLLDAIVRECTTNLAGKPLSASKAQLALGRAALGRSHRPMSRRLLKGATRTPLAKVVGAIRLSPGKSGARSQSDERRELDDFLAGLSRSAQALYVAPGKSGEHSLNQSDPSTRALVIKLATHYNVSEAEMFAAINKSRAWLAETFESNAIANVRRNARR